MTTTETVSNERDDPDDIWSINGYRLSMFPKLAVVIHDAHSWTVSRRQAEREGWPGDIFIRVSFRAHGVLSWVVEYAAGASAVKNDMVSALREAERLLYPHDNELLLEGFPRVTIARETRGAIVTSIENKNQLRIRYILPDPAHGLRGTWTRTAGAFGSKAEPI